MSIEAYIPPKIRTTYDFSAARAGTSMWVATHGERVSAQRAFDRWREESKSPLIARSTKVDDRDPKGPGYRIVFERDPSFALKPAIEALLRGMFAPDNPGAEWVLEYSGVMSADDVVEAALAEPSIPTTVGHANSFRARLFAGETVYQLQHCAAEGKPTVAEYRARAAQEERRQATGPKTAPPPVRRPRPSVADWDGMSAEQRQGVYGAGVTTFGTFAEAVMTFGPNITMDQIIDDLAEGHGDWHAYRTRLAAARGSTEE